MAPGILRAAEARVVVSAVARAVPPWPNTSPRIGGALPVTLIEASPRYTTCFHSNIYLGGYRTLESIIHGYDALRERYQIDVIVDRAVDIDPVGRKVTLASGGNLEYDRLVVAPGIDLRFDSITGYDAAAAEVIPHAWQAGPQTRLLRQQVEAMPEGGLLILAAPPNPYRCPPGPYERVCSIAHHFRQHNPTAKILVLDAKQTFAKQALFEEAWARYYDGIIEWVPGEFGGTVSAVDPQAMTVTAEGEVHKAAVANIIPAQQAGRIAHRAGLTDAAAGARSCRRRCSRVKFRTFTSSVTHAFPVTCRSPPSRPTARPRSAPWRCVRR